MDPNSSQPVATIEQAWLDALQQQCNSVRRPPVDRAATQAEMNAFFSGLDQLERYCDSIKPTADELAASGYQRLSQQRVFVLNDIRGARDAFKAPAAQQLGPKSTKMLALREEQRQVEELSTRAMQMVTTNAAAAEPLLADAFKRAERNFIEQEEALQRLPPWGPAEIPGLRVARLNAKLLILASQGMAAAALGKFDAADQFYSTALAEMGNQPHTLRLSIVTARANLAVMRTQFRAYW